MSGNPFRRSVAISSHDPTAHTPPSVDPDASSAALRFPPIDDVDLHAPNPSPPVQTKKVRITSPPRSPPEPASPIRDPLARRLSQGHHSGSPPPQIDDDASESGNDDSEDPFSRNAESDSDSTEDEEVKRNTRRNSSQAEIWQQDTSISSGAPPNPFSRTLANIEPSREAERHGREDAERLAETGRPGPTPVRGAMDVDSFKRLLMTGNSNASSPNTSTQHIPTQQPRLPTNLLADSSSSTDTSSISRQSLFEPVHETHFESPRTSYEMSRSDDDEHSGLISDPRAKRKPPLPKHRHGKLVSPRAPQTVSFSDFTADISPPPAQVASPSSDGGTPRPGVLRSPSNLNKPLPPPPPISATPESLPQPEVSLPEVPLQYLEAASSSTDNISDKKRTPPPPPLARRHSQLKASNPNTRSRSSSVLTQNSQSDATERGHASPPPPPPTRRRGVSGTAPSDASSMMTIFHTLSAETAEAAEAGDPPIVSPPHHTASAPAMASILPRPQHRSSPSSSHHGAMAPPLPPPRRGSSNSKNVSTEGSRRTSAEARRSLEEGKRVSVVHTEPPPAAEEAAVDVLADLTAFQREVDELRDRYRRVS